MKITSEEFLKQPRKAITLMGMSGAGKSYLAAKMARWGWVNYSCDDLIGMKYLKDKLSSVPADDPMQLLSAFVGKIGNPAKGGLGTEEFRRRQKLYYDAEAQALRDTVEAIEARTGRACILSTIPPAVCARSRMKSCWPRSARIRCLFTSRSGRTRMRLY